jgi:hypothetical protein
MTTARRGQKPAFPRLRRPPLRNFPSGAVRPTLSHTSTIPASAIQRAPSVPPNMGLNVERKSDRLRCHPPHTASSGARSGLHPRSASFTTVALVPSGSASLRMTSL